MTTKRKSQECLHYMRALWALGMRRLLREQEDYEVPTHDEDMRTLSWHLFQLQQRASDFERRLSELRTEKSHPDPDADVQALQVRLMQKQVKTIEARNTQLNSDLESLRSFSVSLLKRVQACERKLDRSRNELTPSKN